MEEQIGDSKREEKAFRRAKNCLSGNGRVDKWQWKSRKCGNGRAGKCHWKILNWPSDNGWKSRKVNRFSLKSLGTLTLVPLTVDTLNKSVQTFLGEKFLPPHPTLNPQSFTNWPQYTTNLSLRTPNPKQEFLDFFLLPSSYWLLYLFSCCWANTFCENLLTQESWALQKEYYSFHPTVPMFSVICSPLVWSPSKFSFSDTFVDMYV